MTGQDIIRNNYPSSVKSITPVKHKTAFLSPEDQTRPHPGFPHPVKSPLAPLPRNKKLYTLNRFIARLAATGYPGIGIAIEYLRGKYRTNLSIHTIEHTGGVILLFLAFLNKKGATILSLTTRDINAYAEHDQDRGLAINSIIGHLRVVYAFVRYLVGRDILPVELLQRKIRIQQPEVLPKAIPSEDIEDLLAATSKKRDRALILLLLRTGMRIGELLSVKVSDIILPERKILLYVGEKNFHGRVVYFSEDAENALLEWLRVRNSQKEYLFYSPTRDNISYVAAWNVMRKLLKKADLLNKGYSLHSLRHTFATTMLNAGLRLEVLQQLLGHKEIDMTLRYARISNKTKETEYFKAMAVIEQGGLHEPNRINSQLQAVFEEKKLLCPYGKKLPA